MALQWIFRGWVASAAKQKLYEAAEEAVRDHLKRKHAEGGAAEGDSFEPPSLLPPCDVGVVVGLTTELGGLVDRLQDVRSLEGKSISVRLGRLRGREVAVVISGGGARKTALATRALLAGHHPRIVIAAGFADSLSSDVRRGDVVMGRTFVAGEARGRAEIAINLQASGANDPDKTEHAPDPGDAATHVGRLLSLESPPRTTAARTRLGVQFDALAVDRDAFDAARVCQQAGVPFYGVRVIRAGLDDEPSPEIGHLTRQTSLAGQAGAILGALARRPSSIKEMWNLGESALTASDRLAEFLEDMIAELPRR